MRWIRRAAVVALGVGALAVALAGEAAAHTTSKHVTLGHRTTRPITGKRVPSAPLPAALPAKYTVATGNFTAAANTQTRGFATCPTKTVPYGGGAVISGSSTQLNLNSSYPAGVNWFADVNNATPTATPFTVYAVCAKKNASYSIQIGTTVVSPAGVQERATAVCPAGTKVTGGGGLSSSGSTQVNLNSSFPLKTGKGAAARYNWVVDTNNATAGSETITAYAVCGHVAGYAMVTGSAVTNPVGSQTQAVANCPAGQVPMGGGGLSSSGSVSVDLNSTLPFAGGWEVYEDNNSTVAALITAYAICAGT